MQESDIHGNKKVNNYGKICFYNGFLYLSESNVEVRIFDNAKSSAPCVVGFIELVKNAGWLNDESGQ